MRDMTTGSTYPLPRPATRQDIASALTSEDPVVEIQDRLNALDGLEEWLVAERTKWNHAMSLAQIDAGGSADAGGSGDAPPVEAATTSPVASGHRPTRREGITAILRSDPTRTWKLSEIFEELKQRGWATGSKNESTSVMQVLADLKSNQIVTRPRTGYYQLVTQPAELEDEGRDD